MENKVIDISDEMKMIQLVTETNKRIGNMSAVELKQVLSRIDLVWCEDLVFGVQQRNHEGMGAILNLAIFNTVQWGVYCELFGSKDLTGRCKKYTESFGVKDEVGQPDTDTTGESEEHEGRV